MKNKFIPEEKPARKLFLLAVSSIILGVGLIALFWKELPPQIPLYYSNPRGEAQLANNYLLPLPLILSLIFFSLNSLLANSLENLPFLRQALILGGATSSILALVTVIRIIFLLV